MAHPPDPLRRGSDRRQVHKALARQPLYQLRHLPAASCATSRELLGSLSERESLVQPGPGRSVCSSLPYPNVILLQGL